MKAIRHSVRDFIALVLVRGSFLLHSPIREYTKGMHTRGEKYSFDTPE